MQIERIDEMRLGAGDEAAIAGLLDGCFENEFDGRSYYQQRCHVRFVARHAGDLLGHLALGLRAVRMGGRLVQIAGVGDVATSPDARGRGIASALLAAGIDEARSSPAEAMMLFGDAGLYVGHGFQRKNNVLRYVALDGAWTREVRVAPKDGLSVLPFDPFEWDDDAEIDLVGHAF